MMLLGDASHGALHEKGTDSDEERVNEPPSSYQNGNEPYPQGTWACQRVRLRICDAQVGTGNEWAGGRGYQTWCRWWQGLRSRWCGNGKRESWVRDESKVSEYVDIDSVPRQRKLFTRVIQTDACRRNQQSRGLGVGSPHLCASTMFTRLPCSQLHMLCMCQLPLGSRCTD